MKLLMLERRQKKALQKNEVRTYTGTNVYIRENESFKHHQTDAKKEINSKTSIMLQSHITPIEECTEINNGRKKGRVEVIPVANQQLTPNIQIFPLGEVREDNQTTNIENQVLQDPSSSQIIKPIEDSTMLSSIVRNAVGDILISSSPTKKKRFQKMITHGQKQKVEHSSQRLWKINELQHLIKSAKYCIQRQQHVLEQLYSSIDSVRHIQGNMKLDPAHLLVELDRELKNVSGGSDHTTLRAIRVAIHSSIIGKNALDTLLPEKKEKEQESVPRTISLDMKQENQSNDDYLSYEQIHIQLQQINQNNTLDRQKKLVPPFNDLNATNACTNQSPYRKELSHYSTPHSLSSSTLDIKSKKMKEEKKLEEIKSKLKSNSKTNPLKEKLNNSNTSKGDIGKSVVLHNGMGGIVRFAGQTQFASGTWFGIELNEPVGKNDGTVDGKTYFRCQKNRNLQKRLKYGIFARESQIKAWNT